MVFITLVLGALGTSVETVFGARVRFTCPEGQVFATGVERIDTRCMPGGKWSQEYIPKCQQVKTIISFMTCFSGKCRLEEKVNQDLLQTCFITEKKISDLTDMMATVLYC